MSRRVSLSSLQNANRSAEALKAMFEPVSAVPSLPAPPPFDAATLPANQQAALIYLTEGHVKRALVSKLMEHSQDFLHDADFAPLRELGLAEKPEGYRLNKLTDAGRASAKLLTQKLCIQFNIHMLIEGGDCGWQVRYSCPCGFSTMVRRSRTAYGNASVQHATHVRTQIAVGNLVASLRPPQRAEG